MRDQVSGRDGEDLAAQPLPQESGEHVPHVLGAAGARQHHRGGPVPPDAGVAQEARQLPASALHARKDAGPEIGLLGDLGERVFDAQRPAFLRRQEGELAKRFLGHPLSSHSATRTRMPRERSSASMTGSAAGSVTMVFTAESSATKEGLVRPNLV